MVVESTTTDVRRREPMSTDACVPAPTLNREQTASLFGRTMVLVGVTAGFFAPSGPISHAESRRHGTTVDERGRRCR
jgi:hypothetical protein